jgi:5-methylcytosine-specific restriction endonuclease McrA
MTKVTDQQIISAASAAPSMREAAFLLGMHPSAFIPRAKRLGVYQPNQGRAGTKRTKEERTKRDRHLPLEEILDGNHPQYGTALLRRRLIEEGIKELKCEMEGCSTSDPNVLYSLDHIDGNSRNHVLSNLRILCPNCHSKTSTFAGKNKTSTSAKDFKTDKEILLALKQYNNIRQALESLGLKSKGANYKRAERLLELMTFIESGMMS